MSKYCDFFHFPKHVGNEGHALYLCILVSAGFFCQHYAAALVDFLPLYIGMGIKNIND